MTRATTFALAAGMALSLGSGCGPSYETVDHQYDPQASDQENLLGEWVCVEATKAGEPAPDLVGKAIEFTEDLVLMKARPRNNEWFQMHYTLDTDDEPKRLVMNATLPGQAARQSWVDLYRFEDGSQILSRGELNQLPQSFESTPQNGYSLLVYKRVK